MIPLIDIRDFVLGPAQGAAMPEYRWKALVDGMASHHDGSPWVIGEWRMCERPLVLCQQGFDASRRMIDAMSYVPTRYLARVEVRGEAYEDATKGCWAEMRVRQVWPWMPADSVALAIYAAELVLPIFAHVYPADSRPRDTIDAAKGPCPQIEDAWAIWDAADIARKAVPHTVSPTDDGREAASNAAWAAGAAIEAVLAAHGAIFSAGRAATWASWAAIWADRAAPREQILNACEHFMGDLLRIPEEMR